MCEGKKINVHFVCRIWQRKVTEKEEHSWILNQWLLLDATFKSKYDSTTTKLYVLFDTCSGVCGFINWTCPTFV